MLFFISYSDKMFPAFGFGAQIPPTWQVNESTSAVITVTNSQKPQFSTVFSLGVARVSSQLQSCKSILCRYVTVTISVFHPLEHQESDSNNKKWCVWSVPVGVEGVVEAYRMCLPQVKLYGPTNFAPIINHMARFAQQALQQKTASVRFNSNSSMRSTGSLMSLWLCPLSVSAILRPADHHGWSDHRHGSDAWGHSRRLTLAHVDHHRGRRQSRLRRHGDSGRRWRTSEVHHGRTGCAWHRAVCALQKVPEREWKTGLRSFVLKLFWASICFRFFLLGSNSCSFWCFLRYSFSDLHYRSEVWGQ